MNTVTRNLSVLHPVSFLLAASVIVALATQAPAQTTPLASCGTIESGVTCPKLFRSDVSVSGVNLWSLSTYGSFNVGDRAYVTGNADPGCLNICQQGNGCISGNTIGSCDPSTHFCFGDGSAVPCPCSNSGATGHGCANSDVPAGALESAAGSTATDPGSGTDTIVLAISGTPATVNSIYLQSDTQISPVLFGDGLRCVGGLLKRLALKTSVGGASQFPQAGDPSVSQRSAALGDPILGSGATRYYQTYYRNPDPVFCPTPPGNTWNVSNGLILVW